MIETLQIDGFRGLDGVDLGPLARVNVIVGPGGSGKTSLLEAVYLFSGTGVPGLLPNTLAFRGINFQNRLPLEVVALLEGTFSARRAPLASEVKGVWSGVARRSTLELAKNEATRLAPEP